METIQTPSEQLTVIVQEANLEEKTQTLITNSFSEFFEKISEWKERAHSLVVTDVSQAREMKMAREGRLALKDIRVAARKTKDALKEESIRYGKAVQACYNLIESLVTPLEDHLEKQEKFEEYKKAEELRLLRLERDRLIEPYIQYVVQQDFGVLTEDEFNLVLDSAKLMHENKLKQEQEAREEQERLQRVALLNQQRRERALPYVQFWSDFEKQLNFGEVSESEFELFMQRNIQAQKEADQRAIALQEEMKRLKEENDAKEAQLKREREEAAEKERIALEKARKEKEEADRILAEERKQREEQLRQEKLRADKLAEEAERKRLEELKAAEDKLLEERKMAAAPDNEKLQSLISSIEMIKLPDVSSDSAKAIISDVKILLGKVTSHIRKAIVE